MALLKFYKTCCNDLNEALNTPQSSVFFLNSKNELTMNVGKSTIDNRNVFYDMKVSFCPYCGSPLPVTDSTN